MKKVINILQKLEEVIIILCLSIMGLAMCLQIVMRFFFSQPFTWVEELARYLQIWITFLGIGYGIRQGSHISMSLIKDKMPQNIQYIFQVICNLGAFFAFIILLQSSIRFLSTQNTLSTAMEIPMYIVYSIIPIGAVIYLIYNIYDMIAITKNQFFKGDKL